MQQLPAAASVINSESEKNIKQQRQQQCPPRRLPCEEVELMLQQHRRHPWCMWSGCQRLRFRLSGLKWAGQTQILAQHGLHAPPRWFQKSYQSLIFLYESLWEESRGIPLPIVWNACCLPLPCCQAGLKLGPIEQWKRRCWVARIKPNMGLNDWQFNYVDVAPHSMKRTCLSCPIICIQFHIKLIPAWVGWHRNQKYSFQCDTIPSKKISLRRPPANRIA